MSYFNKFPIIEYNGKFVRNITARVALSAKSLVDLKQYQPYSLPSGIRADELAFDYYGSSSRDWMLYLSNNVVDPYYDWPLEDNVFDDYLANKYGSLAIAREGISHYEVNWRGDTTIIDTVTYNGLPAARKEYWTVNASNDGEIINYKRKPIDSIINSNKTLEIEVANTSGFIVGEHLRQLSGLTLVGVAQISAIVNTSTIIANKVTGTFSNGTVSTNVSDVTTTITNVLTLSTNIHDDVSIYWQPVTYFDYETELNEKKREIYAIDRSAQQPLDSIVTKLLQDE